MNALMNSQKILQSHLPMDLISSWSKAFVAAHGERSGEGLNTMSETAPVPPSPKHEVLHKRKRLSLLLDSLAFQLKEIKNHDEWSMPESKPIHKVPDDVPLDLSVKSKTEGVDEIVTPPQEIRSEPFVCGACGQSFTVQDRLAKHVASRHRNKTPPSGRAYECSVCLRRFARSDMLTRHARLHTGLKPYACSVCGQLFSRSDHLATHQRTHTGEKPYHCPTCPYSACRRDMITRHLRTHTRKPQPA